MIRRDHLYILNRHGEPVLVRDLDKWIERSPFDDPRRVVKQEIVKGVMVSTVFLGIDHNFNETGPPILWETMTFGKKQHTYRCAGSREQALAQHERVVRKLKAE